MLTAGEISSALNRALEAGRALAIISAIGLSDRPAARLLVEEGGTVVGGTLGSVTGMDETRLNDLAARQALSLIADERQEIVTLRLAELAEVSDPSASAALSAARLLFEIARPPLELIICGGGHVGQAVARAGEWLGFAVTVIDDRADFVTPERFPGRRVRLITDEFTAALRSLRITPASHLVIVTRGHKHDELCLREVVAQPARYIGMIGSRRRTTTIRSMLKREGVEDEQLRRVRAPIGLDIGAQTPEEIALSILAEIVMLRRGGEGRPKSDFVRRATGTLAEV